jgi:hypothetical protein
MHSRARAVAAEEELLAMIKGKTKGNKGKRG